jgi:gamma-glutamyltranspeptidase / glutathione hydrolase
MLVPPMPARASATASGRVGVVATTHPIAAQVGLAILEQGGNAFDAAVAAGLTLQIVECHQTGLGGEVVLQAARAGEDRPVVICGQGSVPAAASIARYRGMGLAAVPTDGPLSAVVPGAFGGWMLLLRDHGSLSLAEVMAPAIHHAEQGFAAYQAYIDDLRRSERRLRAWPSSASIYLPGGDFPRPGERVRNPALAATFARLLREGEAAGGNRERRIEAARRAYYEGFVAEAIDRFGRVAIEDEGGAVPSLVTGADLAGWRATAERPVAIEDGGWRVFKPGFWSQGPAALQILGLLRRCGAASLDPDDPQFVHLFVEATKLAHADREAWFGDTLDPSIDRASLLSDSYLDARARLIGERAAMDFAPGRIDGQEATLPAAARRMQAVPEPADAPRGNNTSNVIVIDRHGNIVAATPSGGWLGGNPAIPELGFALNNRAQMCWLEEGLASSLRPGTRPRTTLSPSLAFHADGTRMGFGCRGSDMQDQWALQCFVQHAWAGWTLADAVERSHFIVEHGPPSMAPRRSRRGKVTLREDFAAVAPALAARGHDVAVGPDHRWHVICAAVARGGVLSAATSPDGAAAGR